MKKEEIKESIQNFWETVIKKEILFQENTSELRKDVKNHLDDYIKSLGIDDFHTDCGDGLNNIIALENGKLVCAVGVFKIFNNKGLMSGFELELSLTADTKIFDLTQLKQTGRKVVFRKFDDG